MYYIAGHPCRQLGFIPTGDLWEIILNELQSIFHLWCGKLETFTYWNLPPLVKEPVKGVNFPHMSCFVTEWVGARFLQKSYAATSEETQDSPLEMCGVTTEGKGVSQVLLK